jgi:hypothetical protein
MPSNAGCDASMPVSSTATLTPSPENGDLSAPTASIPHAVLVEAGLVDAGLAAPGRFTGAMSFMGIAGATASTSRWRFTSSARRAVSASTSTAMGAPD